MKKLYQEELDLIKSSLWDTSIPFISNEKEIIEELNNQSILSLIKNLNNEELNSYIVSNLVNLNKHLKISQLINEIFKNNNISYVFFKGLSNSYFYNDSIDRQLGDIDILVIHEDYDKASKVLESNGFKLDHVTNIHHCFDYEGIPIELHQYFGSFDTLDKSIYFDSLVKDGIQKRNHIDINGVYLPVLSDLLIGIIQIEHIDFHIRTGMGLRQIIDFMMFLNKHQNDNFWLNEFLPITNKLELTHLTKLVTRTCINFLGLKDNYKWCNDINYDDTRKFIELILDNGDFSKKRGKLNTKAISINRNDKSFREKIIFIHNKGKEKSKFLKKHESLSFLGFIFGVKYGLSIVNNSSIKDINNSMKESKNYSNIIKQLGIKDYKKRYDYYEGKFIEKDEG